VQRFRSLFTKKKSKLGVVALSFTADGIAIAISKDTAEHSVRYCEFIPSNKKYETLKDLTEKHKLDQYECHLVLATEDYRLISLEAPPVADDEMLEAIRWKINELIDFAEDALIDYYNMPKSERANSKVMIEVVAAPKATVQPLVDLCLNCGLTPTTIDTQEMALRNLASLLPENDRGIAVLHLEKVTGHIIIDKQNTIYLNRKVASGYNRLGLNEVMLSDEQVNLEQSGLALEIQRSIDHVEHIYNLPPSSELAVLPLPENTQGLLNFLNNNYGITARVLDLATIIDCDIALDDNTQSHCATVIGATLRHYTEESL